MDRFNHDITMETLQEAFGHYRVDADMRIMLELLDGKANMDDNAAVQVLRRECYNEPSRNYKLMTALNDLLDAYGVEVIRDENHWDKYYGNAVLEYINMGDPYAATIVHDLATDEYHVMSWGDAQEAYEQGIIEQALSD